MARPFHIVLVVATLVASHCCSVQAVRSLERTGSGKTQSPPAVHHKGTPCSGTPKQGAYGGEKGNGGVGSYEATCANNANQNCHPCNIWYQSHIAGNVCLLQPLNCAKGFWTWGNLAVPNAPVRGIEDMTSASPSLVTKAEIWQQAWDHGIAQKLMTEADGALVINSANYRSEHQMHIHMGKMDHTFQKSCVAGVTAANSFSNAKTLHCDVPQWVHNNCVKGPNCYNGWELQGTKQAAVKAISVPSLTGVWADYVKGESSHPAAADAWHTGLAVMRDPAKPTSHWLVMMFSSDSPKAAGGVGDHELLWEH